MKQLKLWLPMPPSINHYYGIKKNGQRYLKPKALWFRREVLFWVKKATFESYPSQPPCLFQPHEKLALQIIVYPPNKRRRDLDNLLKALLDALQAAGVFHDDAAIKDLRISFAEPVPVAGVSVQLSLLDRAD